MGGVGGLGNQTGDRGKSQLERRGLDVKFNTYKGGGGGGGALLFSLFSPTGKVIEELFL